MTGINKYWNSCISLVKWVWGVKSCHKNININIGFLEMAIICDQKAESEEKGNIIRVYEVYSST